MQISCPKCKKIFEVNEDLIPKEGRDVQCGSCENKWFFTKTSQIKPKKNPPVIKPKVDPPVKEKPKINKAKLINVKTKISENNIENQYDKSSQELITKKNKINYFKLLLVIVISIAAAIIFADTFKNQISVFFPDINSILENLYESLRDINLFIKDLFN
tara:strand:+ start:1051 stop:1527 length:477 start_codon:yes stop_codon:yes gene_type:complete